jgi:hypothetical protein
LRRSIETTPIIGICANAISWTAARMFYFLMTEKFRCA